MIKKVSIQLNQSLICGGIAIVERGDYEECIDFDVVKGGPAPQVIVGGRGKRVPVEDADHIEKALLELFVKHKVLMEIGTYIVA